MVCFEAKPHLTRHVIYIRRGYIVPRHDGRLLAGSTSEHASFANTVTAGGISSILQNAHEISPAISNFRLSIPGRDCGQTPPDGLPVLGPCGEIDGLFYATGHYRNGILLAPITGELISEAIVEGVTSPLLAPFSPNVFSSDCRFSRMTKVSSLFCLSSGISVAVCPGPRAEEERQQKPDTRSAQELYEDANGYLGRRYQEFNKQKLPYDPKLEAQTKKEQKDLAITKCRDTCSRHDPSRRRSLLPRHASSPGEQRRRRTRDNALFLKDDPDGQKPQTARNVVVLYAVKKNLIPEAKAAIEAYARHKPQNPDDRYRMEFLIADGFLRAKDYAPMATHAKQMLAAAKSFARRTKTEVFQTRRDVAEVGISIV